MHRYTLHTLGDLRLEGPAGAVPLDTPALGALLVMLAVHDGGVSEDELLLRLFPDATASRAREELGRLIASLRERLGDEAAVVRDGNRYALAPGLVRTDVRLGDSVRSAPDDAFLANFTRPSPEFDEWRDETRHRIERQAVAERRPVISHGGVAVGIAVGVLLLSLAFGIFWRRGVEAGVPPGSSLLLADLRNETEDSTFSGLMTAARIGLEQSDQIELYPRQRLQEIYALMGIANADTTLTFDLAQEVAEREGVRFVLGLAIARDLDGFSITGRLADVVRRDTYSIAARANRREAVVATLDSVLRAVRREMGESAAEVATSTYPLPDVTTTSLEALRSYAGGAWAWDHGDYQLARELWERATDLDTGFASALGALGSYHYYHHDRAKGAQYFQAALRSPERITERERLRILEGWAAGRGDRDSAIALAAIIAERYPNAVTWANYGGALMRARRDEEAVPVLRRSLTFDSTTSRSANTWINLATVLARLERVDASIAAYHRAALVDSTSLYRGNINHEYGMKLVELGRFAEAESAYAKMERQPSLRDRAAGQRSLGHLAIWRGRIPEGKEHFQRAVETTAQMHFDLSELRNHLLLASALRLSGEDSAASAQLDHAVRLSSSQFVEPGFLSLVVLSLVKHDRFADADSVLRILRSRVDTANVVDVSSLALASGAIALGQSRLQRALDLMRQADAHPLKGLLLSVKADVFTALGRLDSAAVTLRALAARPSFGAEGQEEWLRAHVRLGDVLLAQGDTAGARTAYQQLVNHWRDAPPSIPELAVARARIIALAGRDDR